MNSLDSSAFIDLDDLIIVNPWEYDSTLIHLGLRNAGALIASFFSSGYRYVVLCSGCERQENLEYLISYFEHRPLIRWYYLDVPRDERDKRRRVRRRDAADNQEWFDLVESTHGPYEGAPKMERVIARELKTDCSSAEEIVNIINQDIRKDELCYE